MDKVVTVNRMCNVPFLAAVERLETDAAGVLQPATDAAVEATNDIVLNLESRWAWFDVHEAVTAEVGELSRTWSEARMPLSWKADDHRRLLPSVDGHLALYSTSSKHTEVVYSGHYVPPFGLFSSVSEAVAGRRVMEAAVGHVLDQIVSNLEASDPDRAGVS